MRVYLSGPMTGIDDWNFPAFNQAADELHSIGCEVTNPADDGDKLTWNENLTRDVADILASNYDALVLLPGWAESKGALLEVTTALLSGVVEFQIRIGPNAFEPIPLGLISALTGVGIHSVLEGEAGALELVSAMAMNEATTGARDVTTH